MRRYLFVLTVLFASSPVSGVWGATRNEEVNALLFSARQPAVECVANAVGSKAAGEGEAALRLLIKEAWQGPVCAGQIGAAVAAYDRILGVPNLGKEFIGMRSDGIVAEVVARIRRIAAAEAPQGIKDPNGRQNSECSLILLKPSVQSAAAAILQQYKLAIEHAPERTLLRPSDILAKFPGDLLSSLHSNDEDLLAAISELAVTGHMSPGVIKQCFPSVNEVLAFAADRIEQKALAERESTERLEKAERIKQEELKRARRAQEERERQPGNILMVSYTAYVFLRQCLLVRQDYWVKFITESELERAKIAVAGIEREMKKRDPSIDSDRLWSVASSHAFRGVSPNIDECQRELLELEAIYRNEVPEALVIPKDF